MNLPLRIKFTLLLTSFSLLFYEVTLLRVYAILQWQNFFSVIISMSMLGFGISGSLLFILNKRVSNNREKWVQFCLVLYPVTLFSGFLLTCKLPFSPFLLGHENIELLYLVTSLLCIIIPFIFGSSIFGILIQYYNIHKLYSINLVGSGLGALAVVIIQFVLHPFNSLALITGIAFITSIVYSFYLGKKVFIPLLTIVSVIMLLVIISFDLLNLKDVSEFKSISQTLSTKNSRILYERYSPYGLIQVVEADGLRSFSGLSMISNKEVPTQKRIYFDGDAGSAVIPYRGDKKSIKYLGDMTSALPYIIKNIPSTLVVGSGGGEGVLRALHFNCEVIVALEINRDVVDLMRNELLEFSGGIYKHPNVKIVNSDLRSYINNYNKKYSLIELSFFDSSSSVSSGVNALNESYLYTVDSVENMYEKLKNDGLISITRWTVDPPRDNIKLLATVIEALNNRGVNSINKHIIAIRSLQTFTLLISRSPFTSTEILKAKEFSLKNLFDLVYYPGIKEFEANRFIRLKTAYYYNSAVELLSDRKEEFIKNYIFNIKPATDDKPYFYNFFKLKTLKHIQSYGINWIPVTDWGYLLILFILLFVIVVSSIGIILPLTISSHGHIDKSTVLYFSLIGISYFFIEITLIQKSIIYIGNPIYSTSSVIAGLLIYSGVGSYISRKLLNSDRLIFFSTLSIGVMIVIHLLCYPAFVRSTGSWHTVLKTLIVLITLFPLGLLMGIPFPRGLSLTRRLQPQIVPWVWGINGFFSVISIVLSSLISILFGYRVVLVLASLIYIAAGIVSIRLNTKLLK